jgi:hypothetical protein
MPPAMEAFLFGHIIDGNYLWLYYMSHDHCPPGMVTRERSGLDPRCHC